MWIKRQQLVKKTRLRLVKFFSLMSDHENHQESPRFVVSDPVKVTMWCFLRSISPYFGGGA